MSALKKRQILTGIATGATPPRDDSRFPVLFRAYAATAATTVRPSDCPTVRPPYHLTDRQLSPPSILRYSDTSTSAMS